MCRDPRGVHNNGTWGRTKPILDSPHERIRLFKVSDTASCAGVYHVSPYVLHGKMTCKALIPPLCWWSLTSPHFPAFLPNLQRSRLPTVPQICLQDLLLFLTVLDNELLALQLKQSHLKRGPWSKRHCSKLNYVELHQNQFRLMVM